MSTIPLVVPPTSFMDTTNTTNIIGLTFVLAISVAIVGVFIFFFFKDLQHIFIIISEKLFLNNSENRKLLMNCIQTNIGFLFGIFFIACILFYAVRDPKALTSNTSNYAIVIIAALFGSFALYSSLLRVDGQSPTIFIIGAVSLLVFVFIKYFSRYITPTVINYTGNGLKLILLLMILVGLAIGSKIFKNKLQGLQGWPGFFTNLLFYIPCMLSDGLEYILQQYRITPNIVFILLIIEMTLLLLYMYIPTWIHRFIKKSSITLQNKPVFLNIEHQVGNSNMFLLKPIIDSNSTSSTPVYRRNYSISMWVYVNSKASSDAAYATETPIFDYGNGNPKITYKNTSDNVRSSDKGIYTFHFSNTDSTAIYEVSISNQKWNFIVLNYFNSKADLYVNGNLERTFNFTNNVPEYSSSDLVTLGSNNGLTGAICSVNYHKVPLKGSEVATMFNLYYNKNPPVDFIK
jgi:hypothetical protein